MPDERRYSLRFTIATLVVVLLLATVAGVLVIAFMIRSRTIAATAETLQQGISTRITERVVERFRPVSGMLRGLAASADSGRLELSDDAMLGHLVDRIRFDQRMEWLGWIRPDGSGVGAVHGPKGIMALRMTAGSTEVAVEIWAEDGTRTKAPPRKIENLLQVPWMTLALESEGPVWSEPYVRHLDGTVGRACSMAVRSEGEVRGVFGAGFGVEFVRKYLNALKVGESGAVFTLHRESGRVISAPPGEARDRMGPAVEEAAAAISGGLMTLEPDVLHTIAVSHDGVGYRVGIAYQHPEDMPGWVHAIVVPGDELVGYFGGYLTTGLIAVALLLTLAVILARLLSSRVASSLDAIAEDLRKVGSFELAERPAARSLIREVAVVGEATERMKASLRSFGRYVPTDLVRDLLAQGQEARLGGSERPLTLFFSDVAGFTSSSEGMPPTKLVDALGAYLDVLTKAVSAQGGTIDKFIGDGVLAFFNAPRDDPEHVVNGCRAALAVQAALTAAQPDWTAQGLPDFTTRIGLHSAEVVVGNIGTPDRYSYTVIGDGVNLAARLESLNKAYGTLILTSQEVHDVAGDAFVWRAIDRTAVVGRTAGGTVYELVGAAGSVDDATLERCAAYEAALALYLERRFREAAVAFQALAAQDKPSEVLAARAAAYAEAPPPEDWTGVYVQSKK